jgi:ATP/maltotriose-dependent transcriptional regulator MalT
MTADVDRSREHGSGDGALLIGHGRILLAQGQLTSAQTSLDTAERLLDDAPWARQYQLDLRMVQCCLAVQRGDLQRAVDFLTAALSADDLASHPHEAWPLLAVGTQIGATALAARVNGLTSSLPMVSAVDAALQLVVTAAITENPPAWGDAVQAWRTLGQPYEQAQALFEAAQAHLAAGNRTAAQSALNGSVGIARALGASPLVDAVEQLRRVPGSTSIGHRQRGLRRSTPIPSD